MDTKAILKYLKLNESTISMVFGVLVVVVLGFFLFNFVRGRGSDTAPQVTPEAAQSQVTPEAGKVPTGLPGTHKVVLGESLWQIAERYYGSGYNWTDIAEANNLSNPGMITEGQELVLPSIVAKAGTGAGVAQAPTPTPTIVAQVTPTPAAVETQKAITGESYMVVKGDHLWGIAVRAYGDGYQWVRIWRANKNIVNPDIIYVGQILTLPLPEAAGMVK